MVFSKFSRVIITQFFKRLTDVVEVRNLAYQVSQILTSPMFQGLQYTVTLAPGP